MEIVVTSAYSIPSTAELATIVVAVIKEERYEVNYTTGN